MKARQHLRSPDLERQWNFEAERPGFSAKILDKLSVLAVIA
jgi:hypothetical protein